ncbi:long-chain-fatty-acid--CoA ligase [Saccharothrix lopnurensis]|uniref:Long-chain-fatty-acid--CoA ligase n=1 Tax=Saccharothrix lopnurensis TaxID=1670621 RepID=A0ABW1PDV4_9PSEU
MRDQGIGSWPARRARGTPDRVAVVHEDREWTYRQLHDRVLRLAHALRRLGVRRGHRVAYLGPNHPAFLETFFAAGALGAVFVPLNARLAPPEAVHVLTDSGSTVLVHAPEQADLVDAVRDEVRDLCVVALAGPAPGGFGYDDLLGGGPPEPLDEAVLLDDPCLIMYTSGTTGRPKGAVLTHGNITWNTVNVLIDMDLASDEVTLVVAPLFHAAGLNMACLPALIKGGTAILVPRFDPDEALRTIERRRVTHVFGVPTMFRAMAASPRWVDADLSSLRLVHCGGAPVPRALIRAYLERGLSFGQGYGMTETSPGALCLSREMGTAKAGSAGVPHFFTDVRVVRPDRTEAEPGEKGEIVVSGPNVMRGYWRRPEETALVLTPDGWFRSGDVATSDPDGYVTVVDRVKDVIISGGENVYPAEVENLLHEHPDIAGCGVIGVPDPEWGEVGRAVVVPRPGTSPSEAQVLGFLRGKLAGYKIPRSVVFAAELPHSAAGKLLKELVRARYGADRPSTGGSGVGLTAEGLDGLTTLAGTELGHTAWHEVTQGSVDLFADATGDHQWIHVDVRRAASGPFGGTIAHGHLTLSLVLPLFGELLTINGVRMSVNYGLNKVRFPAPVPVGARIRLRGAVGSVAEIEGGVEMVVDFTVELDGGDKPACVAQAVLRHYA